MLASSVFNILGIEKTRDKNAIRDAYRKKLILVNPEDHPEDFIQLRQAYEEALRLADETSSVDVQADTPAGKWMKEIEDVYTHIDRRIDVSRWRELFDLPFFQDLDTSDEAKIALLSFLSTHYFLPQAVWILINEMCAIELRIDEYEESFPRPFLLFLIDHQKNSIAIPLELFSGNPASDYDAYINTYFSMRRLLESEDPSGVEPLFEELENADIAHPYLLGERIRYAIKQNDSKSVRTFLDQYEKDPDPCRDHFMLHSAALGYWMLQDFETALDRATKILEFFPLYFGAHKLIADYNVHVGDLEEAYECYMKLFDIAPYDPDLDADFKKFIPDLIHLRENRLTDCSPVKERIELCWNYYQNGANQKALDMMLTLKPETEEDRYSYTNLIGRLYFFLGRHDEALPHLLRWKEKIEATVDDQSEKIKRRLLRKGTAYFMIAQVWFDRAIQSKTDEDFIETLFYLDQAIAVETPPYKLTYIIKKAELFEKRERYEECFDFCNTELRQLGNFIPLLFIRQKAASRLGRVQEAINDFYSIVQVVPQHPIAYALAAEALLDINQFQECKNILELAQQNNVNTPRIRLIELIAKRKETDSIDVLKSCISDLNDLEAECQKMDPKDCDIEDLGEIGLERARANMAIPNFCKAASELDRLSVSAPDNETYCTALALVYIEDNNMFAAETVLRMFLMRNPNSIPVLLQLGELFRGADQIDEALEIYLQIQAISPSHKTINYFISRLFLQKNERTPNAEYLENALIAANKQLALFETPENLFQRALVYLDRGDLKEAIEDFQQVAELDAANASLAHSFIGDAYKIERNFQKAIKHYLTAWELSVQDYDYRIYQEIAVCYESMALYSKALEFLASILQKQPSDYDALIQKARIFYKQKMYETARSVYVTTLALFSYESRNLNPTRLIFICDTLENNKLNVFLFLNRHILESDAFGISARACGEYFNFTKRLPFIALWQYRKGYRKRKKSEGVWSAELYFADLILNIYHERKNKIQMRLRRKKFFDALSRAHGNVDSYLAHPHERKRRLFIVGRILFYSGETEEARTLFEQMNSGKNCSACHYRLCVGSIVGQAMLLESEGRVEEAVWLYKQVIEEGFECERFVPYNERLKKKIAKQRGKNL